MKPEVVIKCQNLATGYGQKVISPNLNLETTAGKLVMLMGPNGCGKSTLMRTISGLQKPLSGTVHISGKDVIHLSLKERAKLLSLVLTDRFSVANLTVQDIVSVGRYPYVGYRGKLRLKDRKVVAEAISKCNLEGFEERLFSEMSDGEKQRTMIARALAQETPVMLLDEPTAHLDLPGRIEIIMMLHELAEKNNMSILVTTHELDLTLQWGDVVWLMDRSGVVRAGLPEDMVLQGEFGDVFGNDKVSFDPSKGQFIVSRPLSHKVSVLGDGNRLEWTCRALERNGYQPVHGEHAKAYVKVGQEHWSVSHDDQKIVLNTIGELLIYLDQIYQA